MNRAASVEAAKSLSATVDQIGREVVALWADDVDQAARFPSESIDALKQAGLLGALVPVEHGGLGCSVSEVGSMVETIGRYCASTAMILAMHQIQVACIVRHGDNPFFRAFQAEIADSQLLLASATTELGVGGDVRTSLCALEADGDRYLLTKKAPVISYGESSDAILVTARRDPDSAPSDQVIVMCRTADTELDPLSGWDTLGFRGTCSLGYTLKASGPMEAVIPEPYGDVSAQTMLPVSHILWASVWLGIAAGAMAKARKYVQSEARSKPGTPPVSAMRLSEATAVLEQFKASVSSARQRYEDMKDDRDGLSSVAFALSMNSLKLTASTLVVDIVGRAMNVCGISSYRHDSQYSLGRYLRDSYGAGLMVNNDRIHQNNAQLLLVHREA